MTRNGWDSVLAAVAVACAGEDGCCRVFDDDGSCCMTDRARGVFEMLEAAGGPSLESCEAIARGDLVVAHVVLQRPVD